MQYRQALNDPRKVSVVSVPIIACSIASTSARFSGGIARAAARMISSSDISCRSLVRIDDRELLSTTPRCWSDKPVIFVP
jgi:hypothetical protein